MSYLRYNKDGFRSPDEGFYENSSNHFYDASKATKMCEAIKEMSESKPCDEVKKRLVVVKT